MRCNREFKSQRGMLVDACHPAPEAAVLGIQGKPWLQSKLKASLDYKRFCPREWIDELNKPTQLQSTWFSTKVPKT